MITRPGGWFKLNGVGERSLAEQMRGVGGALAECRGRTVLDFGCAEGLIAEAFARAGASSVFGIDYNAELIADAKTLESWNLHFQHADIRQVIKQERASGEIWQYDIVLALAVLHKLDDPVAAARFMAATTRSLMVVRLPKRSTGAFKTKNFPWAECDLNKVLPACGLHLEATAPGARGELVQYWRREGRDETGRDENTRDENIRDE